MKLPSRRPYLNVVGHWKIWYAISVVFFVVALVSLFTRGLNFGLDFTGGTELTVKTRKGVAIQDVRKVTGKFGYSDAKIQAAGDNTFIIGVPELTEEEKAGMTESLGRDARALKDAEGRYVVDIKDVGPGWGAQVSRQAAIAFAVFILAVLVYISFRFEFKMAVTAIFETLHDFVITVGIYALLGLEVAPATIIAVLTVLGYSLYDTIVIFDRVKENVDQLTRQSRKTYSQTVNDSVNQVIVRSLNTSLTTLLPIGAILMFGGATLKVFAFPLFIGVILGTYSSIILCPPVLAQLKETEPKYKAYRERVERARVKGAAPAAGKTAARTPAARGRAAGAKAGTGAAGGKQAGRKPAGAQPRPGAGKPAKAAAGHGAGRTGPDGAPAPGPKPRPKPAAGGTARQTSKSRAKSRTKGPGSGKKKKKKR